MVFNVLTKLRVLSVTSPGLVRGSTSLFMSSPACFMSTSKTTQLWAVRPLQQRRSLTTDGGSSGVGGQVHERLGKLTTRSRVVVLMKGEPSAPKCGFSNAVCRILEAHGVLDKRDPATGQPIFTSFDVLSDETVREGAKAFADWPTFPQVYVDGEFVGGCDILMEMHRSGSLAKDLEKRGIGSLLSVTQESPKK